MPFSLHHPTQHTSKPCQTGLLTQKRALQGTSGVWTRGGVSHASSGTRKERGKDTGSPLPGSCPRQSKPRQSHGTLRALWPLEYSQEEGGTVFSGWLVHGVDGAGRRKSTASLASLITRGDPFLQRKRRKCELFFPEPSTEGSHLKHEHLGPAGTARGQAGINPKRQGHGQRAAKSGKVLGSRQMRFAQSFVSPLPHGHTHSSTHTHTCLSKSDFQSQKVGGAEP